MKRLWTNSYKKGDWFYIAFIVFAFIMTILFFITYLQLSELKGESEQTLSRVEALADERAELESQIMDKLSGAIDELKGCRKEIEVGKLVKNLGEFKITVYTPHCDGGAWGYSTASGQNSEHLSTCAVDPKVIDLGSQLKVGNLQLKAIDTGSAVKGNVIDIFYDGSIKEAYEWLKGFGTKREVLVLGEI